MGPDRILSDSLDAAENVAVHRSRAGRISDPAAKFTAAFSLAECAHPALHLRGQWNMAIA